jgi:hypothetical protein
MRPLSWLPSLSAALVLVSGSGCVTTPSPQPPGTTSITTRPSGARVFINGREVCTTTPCTWNEGNGLASRYRVQVRMAGYEELELFIDKELVLFTGTLGLGGYRFPTQLDFALTPLGGTAPPEGEGASPAPLPPGGEEGRVERGP